MEIDPRLLGYIINCFRIKPKNKNLGFFYCGTLLVSKKTRPGQHWAKQKLQPFSHC